MRMRDIFVSELTVSKRSRRYAEPMDLYKLSAAERESIRDVNRVRSRPKSGRCPVRWPFVRKGFR